MSEQLYQLPSNPSSSCLAALCPNHATTEQSRAVAVAVGPPVPSSSTPG